MRGESFCRRLPSLCWTGILGQFWAGRRSASRIRVSDRKLSLAGVRTARTAFQGIGCRGQRGCDAEEVEDFAGTTRASRRCGGTRGGITTPYKQLGYGNGCSMGRPHRVRTLA